MAFSALETTLITIAFGLLCIFINKFFFNRVALPVATFNAFEDEFKIYKEKHDANVKNALESHEAHCPTNRNILLKTVHDADCERNTLPIRQSVERLERDSRIQFDMLAKVGEKLDDIRQEQTKAITAENMMQLIEQGLKKGGA